LKTETTFLPKALGLSLFYPYFYNPLQKLSFTTFYCASMNYLSPEIGSFPSVLIPLALYYREATPSKKQWTVFCSSQLNDSKYKSKNKLIEFKKPSLEATLSTIFCAGLGYYYLDAGVNYAQKTNFSFLSMNDFNYITTNIKQIKTLTAHTINSTLILIPAYNLIKQQFFGKLLKLLISKPNDFYVAFKSNLIWNLDDQKLAKIQSSTKKLNADALNSGVVVSYLTNENYVESIGYSIKNLFLNPKNLTEMTNYSKFAFMENKKRNNLNSLKAFSYLLPFDVDDELKKHYANEVLQDISNGKYEFTLEEKTQLISSFGLYFNERNPDFAKQAWTKYIELAKQDTTINKELESSGGTRGTAKKIISKQREHSIRDFAIIAKQSKKNNEENNQAIINEYYQTKFLEEELSKTTSFGKVPQMLYLDENIEDKTTTLFEIQSWWPSVADYCATNKLNKEQEYVLFSRLLAFTEQLQNTLQTGFEYDGKRFYFKIIDSKEKYSSKTNLLFPKTEIYNVDTTIKTIDLLLEKDLPLKPTTDSHPLNFLINPEYLKLEKQNPNDLVMKIDNEFSKLTFDAENINLFFFQFILRKENLDKLMKPYMENSVDIQLELLYLRTLAHVNANIGLINPDYAFELKFLKNNYRFINENKNNSSEKAFHVIQSNLQQINRIAENLPKINEYLCLKNP